ELAYEVWLYECDRTPARTARYLALHCPELAPAPDAETIRCWAKEWQLRGDAEIAQIAPNLSARQLGRVFVLADQALATMGAVLAGELDHLKGPQLMARTQTAFKVLELRGLGTAGVRNEQPQLPPSVGPDFDVAALSPEEASRALANLLRG